MDNKEGVVYPKTTGDLHVDIKAFWNSRIHVDNNREPIEKNIPIPTAQQDSSTVFTEWNYTCTYYRKVAVSQLKKKISILKPGEI